MMLLYQPMQFKTRIWHTVWLATNTINDSEEYLDIKRRTA